MVTGLVKYIDNKPLQYVDVYESDNVGTPLYFNGILKGTKTNASGLFSLDINKPLFYVTASYVGLSKQTIPVVSQYAFLNFKLQPSTLEPVTITAKRKTTYGILAALAALFLLNN